MSALTAGRCLKWVMALFIVVISSRYLWSAVNWADVSHRLCQTRFDQLLVGCSLTYIGFLCIRTLRWLMLLRSAHQRAHFADLYLPTAIFISFSLITPVQIGEVLKIEVLKRRGQLDRTKAISLFVVERILDLITVVILAILGLLTVVPSLKLTGFYWLLGGLATSGGLVVLLLIYFRPTGRLGKLLAPFFQVIKNPSAIAAAALLTLMAWVLVILGWQIAFAATGMWLSLAGVSAVMALTTLSILISFVPSGVGISEMVIAELLLTLGVDPIQAQTGALIIRVIGLWWLCIGLLHLLYWWLLRRLLLTDGVEKQLHRSINLSSSNDCLPLDTKD